MPAGLQKIVMAFKMVPDPMQRYKQLLYFAQKLPELPGDARVDDNKVPGCVSQVWVVAELREDGLMYYAADSDSQLTKGLAALLVEGLSGSRYERARPRRPTTRDCPPPSVGPDAHADALAASAGGCRAAAPRRALMRGGSIPRTSLPGDATF